MTARYFGAKKRRGRKSPDVPTEDESEEASANAQEEVQHEEPVVAEPTPVARAAEPQEPLPRDLFQPFTVGDIKRIDSTPDHLPPSKEDTIEGRYAGVLFTTASQNGHLYDVFEDMKYLRELYTHCESFRLFTENAGVGAKEIAELNKALQDTAPFSATTMRFLEVLAENKRLIFIREISEKYAKLYQEFNKEEKVTIISAKPLTDDQQN